MEATFEEKTYESFFNSELNKLSNVYFPIGQVQEGKLGFDSSGFSKSRRLWEHLGYPFWFKLPFTGVELRDIADEMELFLNKHIKNVPKMKVNMLFQYKRPEFCTSRNSGEWKYWRIPYFRYYIAKHQQDILENIHNKFKDRVLVIYASPSTIDIDELVEYHLKKEIIKNSNFKTAIELNSHTVNTYILSGTYSIACSKPKEIKNFDLLEKLDSFAPDISEIDMDNKEFIIRFRKQMVNILNEDKFYSKSFNNLKEQFLDLEKYELLYSFLIMSNFNDLTGIQWIIKI